jgi:competence protein ComEC
MQFFSASFQMSYGIVASLLLLGGPLSESWTQRSSRFSQVPELTRSLWQSCVDLSLRGLVSSLALGFTSILVGSISGVSYFRLLSPVSLWINLLLIPISSQVIYAGFASLVAGLLGLTWLSSVLNHAAALMLWFMEWSVQWALRLPGSHIKALFRWDACGGVLLTVLLGLLLWGYAKKWQLGRLSYWPPFALTALALALFVTYG